MGPDHYNRMKRLMTDGVIGLAPFMVVVTSLIIKVLALFSVHILYTKRQIKGITVWEYIFHGV